LRRRVRDFRPAAAVDFLADDGGGHDEKDYGNQACEKPDALRTSGAPEGATGFAGSHTVQVMFNSWAMRGVPECLGNLTKSTYVGILVVGLEKFSQGTGSADRDPPKC
jgi:hypothetical protein